MDQVAACDEQITSDAGWGKLVEIDSKLPDVSPFDPDLLPDSLHPMVTDVADRMQVPIDFPAVVAVATLAGVCGRRAVIQPKALDDSWVVVRHGNENENRTAVLLALSEIRDLRAICYIRVSSVCLYRQR